MSDELFNKLFGDSEPTNLGSGWISGTASVFFGILSLGGVLTLLFPGLLTLPEAREFYPIEIIRLLIQGTIAAALVLGVISAILRERKVVGLTGVLLGLTAALLGGASTPIPEEIATKVGIGFDWFLLDLMVMTLVFVPIERLWPRHPEQGTFRPEWTTDAFYFLATHLPAQLTTFVILLPATYATKWFAIPVLMQSVGGLALHRAVSAGHRCGRPVSVRHPPGLSQDLVPVAVPRGPSFHQNDGLDRRVAFPLCRYSYYTQPDPYPDDAARVLTERDGRVSLIRRFPCHVLTHGLSSSYTVAGALFCDVPVSPLASRGGSRGDRR